MQDTPSTQDIIDSIRDDVIHKRIALPTLPEVALKIRDTLQDDNCNANSIATAVGQDPAMAARLIQVANSPLYRGKTTIESLQMAVTRLGTRQVSNLVISLAMKQMFQATSFALDTAFREIWVNSIGIAAIARFLAGNISGMDKEEALLAGLIHNIGGLPILTKLDEKLGYDADPKLINHLVSRIAPKLGSLVLRQWDFPDRLAIVPRECINFTRDSAEVDYADIVMVARLQHQLTNNKLQPEEEFEKWQHYPAFAKVGIEPEVVVLDDDDAAEEVAEVHRMFGN